MPKHPQLALAAALQAALAVAFFFSPTTASGQRPPITAGDNSMPTVGNVHLSITTFWQRFDARSGVTNATEGSRQSLGAPFTTANLGVSTLPALAPIEAGIRQLSGDQSFSLSLGSVTAAAEVMRTITPVEAEVGLYRWLSIGASVPYVRSTGTFLFNVNPLRSEGNTGFNPAAEFAGARNTNVAVRNQLTNASAALQERIALCTTTPADPQCAVLLPRMSEAQALVTDSRMFRNMMESVFGSDTVAARAFAPRDGSAPYLLINGKITAFNSAFRELLGVESEAPDPVVARPVPAQVPLTGTELREYLELPENGVGLSVGSGFARQGVGDVEFFVRALVTDGISEYPDGGAALRATVSARARLGTGVRPATDVPFETGTGEGQTDMELGGAANLRLSPRLSITAAARYGVQLAGNASVRIAPADQAYPELFTLRDVQFDPGDYLDFAVQPTWKLGRYIRAHVGYYFMSKQADSYTGTFTATADETGRGDIQLNASVLDDGTATSVQRVGVGIMISNNLGARDTTARLPLEFHASYEHHVGSTGYGVGVAPSIKLRLAYRMRLFGGG